MYFSLPLAYLLWIFGGMGMLGLHRFYLRKVPTGVLWLCTGGLAYFGAAYDFFTLPSQVREANMRKAAEIAVQARMGLSSSAWPAEPRAYRPETPKPASVERLVLKVAKAKGGRVTPGEVALEGDCTVDEARKVLDRMAKDGYAELKVRSSGVVVYVFPEFYAEGREDFAIE